MTQKTITMTTLFVFVCLVAPIAASAETIDPGTPWGLLILEVINLFKGPVVSGAIFFGCISFGVGILMTPSDHTIVRNALRILMGIAIMVGGGPWIMDLLGVSFLI